MHTFMRITTQPSCTIVPSLGCVGLDVKFLQFNLSIARLKDYSVFPGFSQDLLSCLEILQKCLIIFKIY